MQWFKFFECGSDHENWIKYFIIILVKYVKIIQIQKYAKFISKICEYRFKKIIVWGNK